MSWNSFWRGVGDFFTGGAITRNEELKKQNAILAENQAQQNKVNEQNYADQKALLEYQKGIQERIFQREDTAVQRRVNDLIKAGLNPNLASNQGAGAGSVVSMDAPQQAYAGLQYNPNKASIGAGVGQFLSNAVGISQTMTSAIASAQQIGITSDQRKWYKDNNLPFGYNGLAADIAALTDSGSSLIQGIFGAEAADSIIAAIDSFRDVAGNAAEGAKAIGDFASDFVERGAKILEAITSGKITLFEGVDALFNPAATGVAAKNARKYGKYEGLDGFGNEVYRMPSGSRAHVKSASSQYEGNPYI